MIAVTERAKEELKNRLSRGIDEPGLGVRLSSGTPGKFELVADQPRDEDQVVQHGGLNVLLVEREISDMLDGATLDYREADAGLRFVICE
jgi:Fe-S cluster assembly iron-binding protein IscA